MRPHPALMGLTLGGGIFTAIVGMLAESPWISVLGMLAGVLVLFIDDL